MADPQTVADAQGVKGLVAIEEPTRAERSIARRAAESRATIPDLELRDEIDMSGSGGSSERGSVTALLVKACALALREQPRANAAYRDGRFELYSRVNVGVAIETDDSYVIATLFDADAKPVAQIATELEAIRGRARRGELTPPELSGATVTLYNFGALGVASASTVITPPHAAAIVAGAIREAPVVRDGTVVPGSVMTLTLACDHRILYGRRAAGLLARIKALLERPTEL